MKAIAVTVLAAVLTSGCSSMSGLLGMGQDELMAKAHIESIKADTDSDGLQVMLDSPAKGFGVILPVKDLGSAVIGDLLEIDGVTAKITKEPAPKSLTVDLTK